MENDSSKKVIIILIFTIFILFFILIYFWIDTFGILKNKTNEIIYSNQIKKEENKTKKIVIDKKEEKGEYYTSDYDILNQLNAQSNLDTEEYKINSNIDATKFYYSQIDENAKIIYNKLFENKENLKKGNYVIEYGNVFASVLSEADGSEKLKESYSQAIRAFLFDNPEIFFLDVPKLCLITQNTSYIITKEYNVFITAEDEGTYLDNQFPTEAIINAAQNAIDNVVNKILNETENYTDFEKIKYVHDYLVKNVEYDSTLEKASIHDIYGTLICKTAVCEGYAKTFKYILDKMNIPTIIVVGEAKNSNGNVENHSWNYVNIEGKWYGIDVTFDDPIIDGYVPTNMNSTTRYKYFLKGNTVFSEMHNINSMGILEFNVEYPTLEEENYNKK